MLVTLNYVPYFHYISLLSHVLTDKRPKYFGIYHLVFNFPSKSFQFDFIHYTGAAYLMCLLFAFLFHYKRK